MLFQLNSKKSVSVDGVTVNKTNTHDNYEINAKFSDAENSALKTAAQAIERLHEMDGDRMGWLSTLLEKTITLVNAATSWQEAKLKREQIALELARLKAGVQD